MKGLLLSLSLSLCLFVAAQDDLLNELKADFTTSTESNKISATFKGIRLINANTIETTKKKTLEFRITHRFGNMEIGEPVGYHTYWGMDNASNIRCSFDYSLTDKISIGIGRSKTLENIDGNFKYRFLEQKKGGMPISVAYFANAVVSAVADIPQDKFENRLSYTHQLIIASKINNAISLELIPTFVHRNFVDKTSTHPKNGSTDENDIFALGVGGRFKISKRTAFVVDYFLPFDKFRDSANNFYDALGVGFEFETGGHVFHVNITNSAGIIENDFIPYTNSSWEKGEYKLGFNISRVFNF
jgi:hypothetical protein